MRTVAIVVGPDGGEYDECYTWEAGQTYACEGFEVRAVADDGHMDVASAQRLYDFERAAAADCFGPGIRT